MPENISPEDDAAEKAHLLKEAHAAIAVARRDLHQWSSDAAAIGKLEGMYLTQKAAAEAARPHVLSALQAYTAAIDLLDAAEGRPARGVVPPDEPSSP